MIDINCMTRLERIEKLIIMGYTYDKHTGFIYGIDHNLITSKLNGYIKIILRLNGSRKTYQVYGHHFAWYYVNNQIVELIDHIDGDRSNNKIANLRSSTKQQNTHNTKNTKGYCKIRNRFYASIYCNGKTIYLGGFSTEQEAHKAYLDAKKIYHTN